jgi:putative ABC transport system permease protein
MKLELFDPDHWEDIFSHIKKHKVRTLLTAFGVFWGIFLLLMLLAAGSGIEKGAYRKFGRVGVNSIHVWTERTILAYKGNKPGRYINLYDEDTKALRERIPGIKAVCPRLNTWWANTTKFGKKNGSFRISGEVPDIMNIEPLGGTPWGNTWTSTAIPSWWWACSIMSPSAGTTGDARKA